MITCVKEAQQYERKIFCKYIEKCNIFYGSSLIFTYVVVIVYIMGPVVLPAPFPIDTEYPFHVNYTITKIIIYLQQSLLIVQCAGHACISILCALLLWFTAARFECLVVELQKITNIGMLIICIEKQLRLRR